MKQAEIMSKQEMIFKVAGRTQRHLQETRKLSAPLPQPSAMFAATEAPERLLWLVSPNVSSRGNPAVAL